MLVRMPKPALPVFMILALALSASAAAAQPRPVGDPCSQDEVAIPLLFDLYAGRVDPSEADVLDVLAARLAACPGRAFELQVHTDTVRVSSFNARQSRAVAEHVRELLGARGVAAARLAPCGYGESRPLARDPSWDGRSPNYRLVVRALRGGASSHRCPDVR